MFSSAQCFCEAPPPGLHFQPPKHPAAKFICNQQWGQICCCFCFMFLLHFLYIHFLYILYIPLPAPKTSGSKIYLQSTIWPAPRYAAFLLYLFVFFIFYTFICCFIILDLQHPNIRRPSLFAINKEARYAAFLLFLLLLYFHMLFYTTRPAAPQNIRRPNLLAINNSIWLMFYIALCIILWYLVTAHYNILQEIYLQSTIWQNIFNLFVKKLKISMFLVSGPQFRIGFQRRGQILLARFFAKGE